MSEKSQVTQESLYSEERKRGRALGVMYRESEKYRESHSWLSWRGKMQSQLKPDGLGDRLAILIAG
jgi:hypothetical protein